MIASLAQETKTAIKASLDSETSLQAVCTTQSTGITAFLNTSVRIPDHLEIEGTWNGICICGHPVSENIENMVFKCVYRNGSYSLCTPTPSPEIWGETEGEQAITFSYEEGGVVITASKSASVYKPKSVGGILFYIDSSVEGSYQFLDANGNRIDTPAIGTDCTGYFCAYVPMEKDKFYLSCNKTFARGWTYNSMFHYFHNGREIGDGKINTEKVMAYEGGIYTQGASIWRDLAIICQEMPHGFSDWYIPSTKEFDKFRESGVLPIVTGQSWVWSSSDISNDRALYWDPGFHDWVSYAAKGVGLGCCVIRSFGAAELVSLSVSGGWQNPQYMGASPDITGLSFTAVFNNGEERSVASTDIIVSPDTWADTTGLQTATFSYTEDGITVTTTKDAEVISSWSGLPVGGIIFYIDSTADGTYTFHNANDEEVSAPTVGTDCTGWTYMVEGATKDKFYVVYNELYTAKKWGGYGTQIGASGTTIGTGRSNTTTAIGSVADVSGSIWETIRNMRTNALGGCDDWFVGSEDELKALRTSGAGNSAMWFSGYSIWASSETSTSGARYWYYKSSTWPNGNKLTNNCVCGIRAF